MALTTRDDVPARRVDLRELVGAGHRIALLVLPFLAVGLVLNLAFPTVFAVGGPPAWMRWLSAAVLGVGLITWGWSVFLILTRVPRGQLIDIGPYAVVRHPLYTGVALLVLPWLGFLLNTWLGVVIGLAMYVGCRIHARAEESDLAARFGRAWESYSAGVRLPWL
jgi:protein-S-isoprenylcysteine O-methyltransferase Ste14